MLTHRFFRPNRVATSTTNCLVSNQEDIDNRALIRSGNAKGYNNKGNFELFLWNLSKREQSSICTLGAHIYIYIYKYSENLDNSTDKGGSLPLANY